MIDSHNSKLLRIFVGEIDKWHHEPLYEQIVYEAKRKKLAGATVLKGVMSFGASSHHEIHSAKLLRLSEDLPIVVEIVDLEENIDKFIPTVEQMLEESGCGGLITMEKADVRYYKPHNNIDHE